jgi:glycosyltransferase 2 family protein
VQNRVDPAGVAAGRSSDTGRREDDIRRARRRLVLALFGLALVLGVFLLIEKAAGYRGLLSRFGKAKPEWLVVALLAEAMSFAGYIWTLRDVVRFGRGPALRVSDAVRLVFASLGAGRVVAGGAAAGIVVDVWALRKTGLDRDEAGVRVFAFNVLLFGVFGAGVWLAALALIAGVSGGPRLQLTLPWLIAVPVIALALLGLRAPRRRERLPGGPGRWLARMVDDARAAVAIVRVVVTQPRRNGSTVAAAFLYWAGDAVCLWASLRAFGGSIAGAPFVLAYATGYLSTLLPLPLGGVGGVDAAMTLVLRSAGVPLSEALLAVLAYRLIDFWLPTLPGLAAFSTLERLGRRLEQLGRNRPAVSP